jgi:5-methylcytosine-specific restriction endonuclease McrA
MKEKVRQTVYEKYDKRCAYCGCYLFYIKDMQVDHFVSKFHFKFKMAEKYTDKELNDIDNLMPSCRICNKWKSCHSVEQFRFEIESQLDKLNEYSSNFRFAKKYGLIEEKQQPILFYFEKQKL